MTPVKPREQRRGDRLLTVEEVAKRLRVARAFVYRHAVELGAFKIGSHLRFSEREVNEWLEQQRLVQDDPPSPWEGAAPKKGSGPTGSPRRVSHLYGQSNSSRRGGGPWAG